MEDFSLWETGEMDRELSDKQALSNNMDMGFQDTGTQTRNASGGESA